MAHPQPALVQALRFLNHAPPQALEGAETREILAWAVQNWSVVRIPAIRSMEPQI
jgi:hypothetical protein